MWMRCMGGGALALAMWLGGGTALAEPGLIGIGEDAGLVCDFASVRYDCDTTEVCEPGQACVYARSGERYCVGRGSLVCCTANNDCPAYDPLSGAPVDGGCVRADVGSSGGGSAGLCVDHTATYCSDTPDTVSIRMVRRCHTVRDGTELVRWEMGDCDRDGIANGEETEVGVCTKPDIRAYWDGAACVYEATGCDPEDPNACRDHECQPSDEGTWCDSDGLEAYCALPAAECEEDELVLRRGATDFCVPDLCPALPGVDLLDCLVAPGTNTYTGFDFGDCDRDGVANGVELLEGSDPCADGSGAEDGGAPDIDVGAEPTVDAGGLDGGSPGGPDLQPRFGGGGGCVCRATPGGDAPGWLAALSLLGLALLRRR